MRNKENVSTRI